MTNRVPIVLVACVAAFGCKPDPAKSVKIVAPAPAPPAAQSVLPLWQSDFCALPPEDSAGSSNFVAQGKCGFHHEGNAKCRGLADDFHVMVVRRAAAQATVSVYINVEHYHGAGKYDGAQMFLTFQNGENYYYWGGDSLHITVTPLERSVVLSPYKLEAQPPNTGAELVSGTFVCGALLDLNKAANPNG